MVISVSLHALNYQCTEIIDLLTAKQWDNIVLKIETRDADMPHQISSMVSSTLNENPGLSLERIGYQIQGSYGSWKVLEFYYGVFQSWKVLEIC